MTEGYEDHRLLPADTPHGQAHFLVRDGYPAKGRMLGDYIATFLMNLDKHPDALKDFFDPDVKSFHLIRKFKAGKDNAHMEFMISRKKDRVIVSSAGRKSGCGWLTLLGRIFQAGDGRDSNKITWECVTKTKLSTVGPDAKWKTTWGVHIVYSYMPTEAIWNGNFFGANQPGFEGINPRKAKEAKEVADMFGRAFYARCAWEEDEDSEFILTKY